MASQINEVIPNFFDSDGSPLDNGYIYIGTAGLNPETNPVSLYWDSAATIPAAQPLRTSNGYIVRNGIAAAVYTASGSYSVTVRDRNSRLVITIPTFTHSALLIDGSNSMAADLNVDSHKVINLAAATAASDAARYDQIYAMPGSLKLRGNPNAAVPLTKYDLSADYVVLKNSSQRVIAFASTGTKTCDFGAAGSAINSRDQAGAFGANNWVYVYWISDGTNINTLASLSASAPTLPGSYTYFCLAAIVRWNGASNIVPGNTCGNRFIYTPPVSALSGGTATVETAVTITSYVPPGAGTFMAYITSVINSSGGGSANSTMVVRAVTGVTVSSIVSFAQTASQTGRNDSMVEIDNINNTLFYLLTNSGSVSSASGGINIYGYTLPNGAT